MTTSRPVHPGKILKERFLDPLGITPYRLAQRIGVPTRRISELVKGNRRITPDTAIRLGLFFDVPPVWWLEMQARFDIECAPRLDDLRARIARYEGLHNVLVTPNGVRRLEEPCGQDSRILMVQVPEALTRRLRAQVALESPRAPRKPHTVIYADGAAALVGSEQ